MKHAGQEALDAVAPLIDRLRERIPLVEKGRGVFYRKSKAFLHFHEDPAGVFADVKLDGATFERHRVSTATEQRALLRRIDKCLAA